VKKGVIDNASVNDFEIVDNRSSMLKSFCNRWFSMQNGSISILKSMTDFSGVQ
jgi:hypothetical protein